MNDVIKADDMLLKELAKLAVKFEKASARKHERLKEKNLKLDEYKTVEDAQEAYGYGVITGKEYDTICRHLEEKETVVEDVILPEDIAYDTVMRWLKEVKADRGVEEFMSLPAEERTKILENSIKEEEEKINVERKERDEESIAVQA